MKHKSRSGVKLRAKKGELTGAEIRSFNEAFKRFAAKRGMTTGRVLWRSPACNT